MDNLLVEKEEIKGRIAGFRAQLETPEHNDDEHLHLQLKIARLELEINGYAIKLEKAEADGRENRVDKLLGTIKSAKDNLNKQLSLLQQQQSSRDLVQNILQIVTAVTETQNRIVTAVTETRTEVSDMKNEIVTIKNSLKKNLEEKDGSRLSWNHVRCFNPSVCAPSTILPRHPNRNQLFGSIRKALFEYTQIMVSLLAEQKCDEVTYIQEVSFQFFLNICRQYFPNNFQQNISLVKKGSKPGHLDISYSTILRNNVDELTKVHGECDSTLLYGNIPVACWEDKNLTKELTSSSEIGQAFAEVKGISEIFKNSISLAAPRFTGVLTSGLVWSLTIQEFRDGENRYTRTTPIETASQNGTISGANVDIVASLLIYHLETIQVLMQMIDEYHHSLHKKPATLVSDFPQDDHSQDHDDDDDDQGNNDGHQADQENRVTTRLQALSRKRPSRGHAQNQENQSSGKKRAGQNRNVLQVLGQKLSPENLLVHNTINSAFY
jgi:hypothetical protein